MDVLTLNYNDPNTTICFVDTLIKYPNVEHILIVDNSSTDNSIMLFESKYEGNHKVEILKNKNNFGYGGGNNRGINFLIEKYNAKYILLANPDTFIEQHTLVVLEDFLRTHTEYVIVAPFMCNSKGEKQRNTAYRIPKMYEYILSFGMIYSKFFKQFKYDDILDSHEDYRDVDTVSGSLFLMDAAKMQDYGMYDENIFLYTEETVLGIKFRNSPYKIAILPKYTFIHNHSVSINKTYSSNIAKHDLWLRSKYFVFTKYFHPSLTGKAFAKILYYVSKVEIRLNTVLKLGIEHLRHR